MKTYNHFILTLVAILAIFTANSSFAIGPVVTGNAGFNANSLAANDDGSTSLVSLGFTINFFGTSYSNTYVNNNGNLTFTGAMSTYTPFGLVGTDTPIIAPFFADVDTRGTGTLTYGTGTYLGDAAFAATWNNVGYYSEGTDKTDDFQVILVDRADVGAGDFDIYFNYDQVQWETGGASGGSDGLGGDSAVAGYSNGTAPDSFQLAGSAINGALINGGPDALVTASNDGVAGQELFQVRNGVVSQPPAQGGVADSVSTAELLGAVLIGFGLAKRLLA